MVEIIGASGPAVLLLPGGAEAVDDFFPGLLDGLIADPGCRIILYDRPGNGPSDEHDGLRVAAESLHAAIADAGIGPVIAIGQSLGGAAALLLAAAHPEDVAGLVLLDPTPINDTAIAERVAAQTKLSVKLFDMPILGGVVRRVVRRSALRSARRHGMDAAARAAMLRMTDLDATKLGRAVDGIEEIARSLDLTRASGIPTVVVTADRRAKDPVRVAHAALAHALNARVRSWPGAEHAVHLTHTRGVLDECRRVIAEAAGR